MNVMNPRTGCNCSEENEANYCSSMNDRGSMCNRSEENDCNNMGCCYNTKNGNSMNRRGGMNYRGNMNNRGNRSCGCNMNNCGGNCSRGNCGMSQEEMERKMQQCESDSAQRGCDAMYGMHLAMGYVPWQEWGKTYEPAEGIGCGTIFPELNLPFLGCIPRDCGCGAGRGGRA